MISIIIILYALGALLMFATITLAEKVPPAIDVKPRVQVVFVLFWPIATLYIFGGSFTR